MNFWSRSSELQSLSLAEENLQLLRTLMTTGQAHVQFQLLLRYSR